MLSLAVSATRGSMATIKKLIIHCGRGVNKLCLKLTKWGFTKEEAPKIVIKR
jgi:hypothetical protein